FWTPAYRERKREKLRRLGSQVPLLLVTQEGLAEHFSDLPFPLLTYKHRVPAAELIRLLNRHFARPAEDAPGVLEDLVALLGALDPGLGLVGMEELGRALELPASGPVAEALGRLQGDMAGWRRVPGVGVAHQDWLARLGGHCEAVLAGASAGGDAPEAPLETLRESLRALHLPQSAAAAAHLEALLGVLGYAVEWESLFEATVRRRPV
ncbi:MAG TPA: hypothetical protein VH257_11940, partial [Chloroflexota bacterium]|nr:hypothetical protein [Chloroflexota bacterium]